MSKKELSCKIALKMGIVKKGQFLQGRQGEQQQYNIQYMGTVQYTIYGDGSNKDSGWDGFKGRGVFSRQLGTVLITSNRWFQRLNSNVSINDSCD
jgi:hypothetical protein